MSFLTELKRRNVFRVAFGYIVSSWLLAQVADLVLENIGAPDWVMQTILLVLALGFPVVVFFSWAYEVTPEGIKHQSEVDGGQSITHVTGRKLDRAIFGVLVVALGYFIWESRFSEDDPGDIPQVSQPDESVQAVARAPQNVAADSRKSIAVLPFVDMSPQKDQEYFTDGLTENLLNALAQLRELKVAGRTSSFAFKGLNEDLRKIGEQLGVAHVLEGSVQKSGERVRVTAQLINTGDGYHLWSETYDRTLQDIFAVQDEIANEVARAMKVALLGHDDNTHLAISQTTGNAYNTYLKGLYESRRGNLEGHKQSITYFQQALQQDPDLALAWAGLSDSLNYVTGFEDTDFKAGFEEARSAALRALEIDPDLPEGLMALAGVQASLDWDWAGAEATLNRALALRPGDSGIRRELASLKRIRGKYKEALVDFQQVVEQDPLDSPAQQSLAIELTRQGQFAQARQILDHLKEIDPARPVLHWVRGVWHLAQDDFQGALDEFSLETFEFLKLTGHAITYHHLQQKEKAVAALGELISVMGESAAYQIACVYAQWGDEDNAMSWLERAYVIRDPGLQYVGDRFFLDPIADDPRYLAFLAKMNLAGTGN